MTSQIPLVDYLVLEDEPHLVAQECASCGARFFGRRNACASCFATEFTPVEVASTGTLRTFTIVAFGAPGVPVPYVAGVIDCDGTSVRGNVVNTDPTPENIRLGMPVRLTTFVTDTDDEGTEAIGFGYEPVGGEPPGEPTHEHGIGGSEAPAEDDATVGSDHGEPPAQQRGAP